MATSLGVPATRAEYVIRIYLLFRAGLLLEEASKDLGDLLAHLVRLLVASEVLGAEAESTDGDVVEDDADGLLDELGLLLAAERVAEHERDGEDRADRVRDLLAGDVGRGAVNGLVQARDGRLAVWDTAERRGGEKTERAGDDGGLVGENVAEEVLGCEGKDPVSRRGVLSSREQGRRTENDAVELARVGADDHRGRVDERVVELDVGELGGHDVCDDAAPEPARGEHVGLVDRVDLERGVAQAGEVRREAGDARHLRDQIGRASCRERVS